MKWYKYNIEDMTAEIYEKYLGMMDNTRRCRIERKRNHEDRLRSVAAEMLLRQALSEKFGIYEDAVRILNDERGAPYVDGENIHVSISHSGDYAVCAISDTPVGIDIEKVRPICARVAIGTFSAGEMEYLDTDGNEFSDGALVRFYEIWTAKEAYSKLDGSGISLKNTVDTTTLSVRRVHFDGYVVSIVCE